MYILQFTLLFYLFVFVSAAGHYFRIWTDSIGTGRVPALFSEGHMVVYGPVRHQQNIIWTEASEVHINFFW
jgi:hypothetical protein